MKRYRTSAFTIVELLIVIVVIGILATIVVVAFNGVQRSAAIAALQSELKQASTKLELAKIDASDGNYPSSLSDIGITDTDTVAFQYTRTTSPKGYCITATTTAQANTPPYHLSSTDQEPTEGLCDGHTPPSVPIANGSFIQTITAANCPTERIRAVDARDNRTYWVQKLADNQCWMLTNLAYAGGGTNTYGDVKVIEQGVGITSFNEPLYYDLGGANPTTEPTNPSTNTAGGGSGAERQYGYLYNWCGAMGAQTSTTACANHATLPALPDLSISICPANWRLPTGQVTTGEVTLLNNAVNGGLTNTSAGLRSGWLAQYSGFSGWSGGGGDQGVNGYYWTSYQAAANSGRVLNLSSSSVSLTGSLQKNLGLAVRCIAAI